MEPLGVRFGAWGSTLEIADVPDAVHHAARRAILDTIGVIVAGMHHPVTERARQAFGGGPGSAAVVGGGASDPMTAALINGTAAHAYDFDDTSYTGIMHGSAVIVPAIMAAASEGDVLDDTVLAAFIAGSEIAYVLADMATHKHYFRGWWSTTTFGLIGATAAVARVYGLDSQETAHAIGFAAAAAGGGRSVLGTDGKPFLVGDAAKRAIEFAKAARAGMIGPVDVFENQFGFFSLLNDRNADQTEAATLGLRWRLVDPGLLFKRYPVCSAAHAAIDQTAELFAQAQCHADEIELIICEVPELVGISLIYDNPVTAPQAQFSVQFAVACAVLHGGVRLEDIGLEALDDPSVRSVMERTEKQVDPELSTEEMRSRFPESARVTLHLKYGIVQSGFCGEAYGMPQRALRDDALAAKFCDCLVFAGHAHEFAVRQADVLLNPVGSQKANFSRIIEEAFKLPEAAASAKPSL